MKAIKHIFSTMIAALLLVGCNDDVSLQRYFVDHQESKGFITQDLPLSMLKIDESKLTAEQREAFKSVKRLNFLAYKANDINTNTFNLELAKVKTILKNEEYNELIDFTYQGAKVSVKYLGDDEDADEFIVFGSSKDMGFGILRVLGDDMSPEKMMTIGSALKNTDFDSSQFNNMVNFLK